MGHSPSGADIQLLRHELGLDAPLPVQYARYVSHALHGDLGASIRSNRAPAALAALVRHVPEVRRAENPAAAAPNW
jgi:glutathione transport system permease protein